MECFTARRGTRKFTPVFLVCLFHSLSCLHAISMFFGARHLIWTFTVKAPHNLPLKPFSVKSVNHKHSNNATSWHHGSRTFFFTQHCLRCFANEIWYYCQRFSMSTEHISEAINSNDALCVYVYGIHCMRGTMWKLIRSVDKIAIAHAHFDY